MKKPGPKGPLIPVVAQDARTGDVLMVAYADRTALAATRRTGQMHFWSRSRSELWRKGATSGNTMRRVRLRWDCDRDAILAEVEPAGPACHRGTDTCFGARYRKGPGPLRFLFEMAEDRRRHPVPGSYTVKLLRDPRLARRKIGEEALELVLALESRSRKPIVSEAADVLYHLVTALVGAGITREDLSRELEKRIGAPRRPAKKTGRSS